MTSTEKKAWWVLLALSLFARLAGLGIRAMSHDESLHALYSWYWSNGLNYQHDPMMHGPLLFHLNGLLYTLLPITDFTARVIPALLGTGCVAMMIPFRRWLGGWQALCAGILISLDPAHLFYSRYLRNDIYISLFTLLMVWAVFRYRESRESRFLLWLSLGLGLSFACKEVCFIHGVMLGAACVFFSLLDSLRETRHFFLSWLKHPLMQCATVILLLAVPFITGLLIPGGTWSPPGAIDPNLLHKSIRWGSGLIALTLMVGAGYFFWLNKWGTWLLALSIFWGIQISLYTTLFTNLKGGIASGIAGSLGYWWAQHDVQRGSPDPAFYLTLLLLYAPVYLLAAALMTRRIKEFPIAFTLFWAVVHLGIYSWAGERMPWLLLHISLPLCILTGCLLPDLFRRRGRWMHALQVIIALGLCQLTLNSLRLAGPHAEGPWEPMGYAHSGEDVKMAMRMSQHHQSQFPVSRIQVDPDYTWPTAWYLRETPTAYADITDPEDVTPETSVIFVAPGKRETFQAAGWVSRVQIDMTTWPRQRYHRISLKNLKNLATSPSVRKTFWRYYLTRDQPEWRDMEYPGPNRFLLMTRTPE